MSAWDRKSEKNNTIQARIAPIGRVSNDPRWSLLPLECNVHFTHLVVPSVSQIPGYLRGEFRRGLRCLDVQTNSQKNNHRGSKVGISKEMVT